MEVKNYCREKLLQIFDEAAHHNRIEHSKNLFPGKL